MSEWIEYIGTDEQIEEMLTAEHGFIVRWESYVESLKYSGDCSAEYITDILKNFTHYLICNPHPLADMIERWAETGQPVWIKTFVEMSYAGLPILDERIQKTNKPDWNIPGAEYSFYAFEDDNQGSEGTIATKKSL